MLIGFLLYLMMLILGPGMGLERPGTCSGLLAIGIVVGLIFRFRSKIDASEFTARLVDPAQVVLAGSRSKPAPNCDQSVHACVLSRRGSFAAIPGNTLGGNRGRSLLVDRWP